MTAVWARVDRAYRAYGMALWGHVVEHGSMRVPDGPVLVDARDTLATARDLAGEPNYVAPERRRLTRGVR